MRKEGGDERVVVEQGVEGGQELGKGRVGRRKGKKRIGGQEYIDGHNQCKYHPNHNLHAKNISNQHVFPFTAKAHYFSYFGYTISMSTLIVLTHTHLYYFVI